MPLPPDLSKPAFSMFPQFADRVIRGECVTCASTSLRNSDFKNDLSREEYSISGMCQTCQDKVYAAPDWDSIEEMFG